MLIHTFLFQKIWTLRISADIVAPTFSKSSDSPEAFPGTSAQVKIPPISIFHIVLLVFRNIYHVVFGTINVIWYLVYNIRDHTLEWIHVKTGSPLAISNNKGILPGNIHKLFFFWFFLLSPNQGICIFGQLEERVFPLFFWLDYNWR